MSRRNKVNKDLYTQAGRLTPDEAARARKKQSLPPATSDERVRPRAASRLRGKKKTGRSGAPKARRTT